jgi:integrase
MVALGIPASDLTNSAGWRLLITAAELASPLARRPYDLRHACLSTWLNGGVYPTQVAEWAGHSVDVLLRIYARCVAAHSRTQVPSIKITKLRYYRRSRAHSQDFRSVGRVGLEPTTGGL